MRSAITFFICLLLFAQVCAQTSNQPLTITHLTGDLYVFTTSRLYNGNLFPANGMYLVTSKGAVMIDAPWDTTQFQPLLDSIAIKHKKNVIMCIATHYHEDRTGGLAFLQQKGVKTYTTKKTDELSKKYNQRTAAFLMDKDTSFNIGSHLFEVYYAGEGHTADNIVVWFGKEKVLYGGCLVKSTEAASLGNLEDANTKAWVTTIQKLQNKFAHPAFIIPGHQGWTSNQSLIHTLALLKEYNTKNTRP